MERSLKVLKREKKKKTKAYELRTLIMKITFKKESGKKIFRHIKTKRILSAPDLNYRTH